MKRLVCWGILPVLVLVVAITPQVNTAPPPRVVEGQAVRDPSRWLRLATTGPVSSPVNFVASSIKTDWITLKEVSFDTHCLRITFEFSGEQDHSDRRIAVTCTATTKDGKLITLLDVEDTDARRFWQDSARSYGTEHNSIAYDVPLTPADTKSIEVQFQYIPASKLQKLDE